MCSSPHGGVYSRRDPDRHAEPPAGRPPTFLRMYRAPQQEEAVGYFKVEAEALAKGRLCADRAELGSGPMDRT